LIFDNFYKSKPHFALTLKARIARDHWLLIIPKTNTNPITKPLVRETAYPISLASPGCRIPFSTPLFIFKKNGGVVEPIIKLKYSRAGRQPTAAIPKIPPKTEKATIPQKEDCRPLYYVAYAISISRLSLTRPPCG